MDVLAEAYKEQRDKLLGLIRSAPLSTGVCCCGEGMYMHSSPFDCGHTPVDQWDSCVENIAAEFESFDRKHEKETGW